MGMDLLDINLQIEQHIGIGVSFDEMQSIMTDNDIVVGDLYELLLSKRQLHDAARNNIGVNYRFWKEMHGLLHSVTNAPRHEIELKTPLKQLFPRQTRSSQWEAFSVGCPYRVAKLDYPIVLRCIGFSLASAMVIIEQFPMWQWPALIWIWPLLGVIGLWMVSETYLKLLSICTPWRIAFPARMSTVKDLCRGILAVNYAEICADVDFPVDHRCLTVWQDLAEILVDVLGVDRDEIHFGSRLHRDLGAA